MPLDISLIGIGPEQWAIFGGAVFAIGHFRKWKVVRAVGIGALATGLASWAMDHETPTLQLAMFLGCSYLAWRSSMRQDAPDISASSSGRHRVGLGLIGRNVEVIQAIENGKGKIRVGLHEWDAIGPDCSIGTHVKIVAQLDNVLKVRTIKQSSDHISDQ